jgi:hypothetical protein
MSKRHPSGFISAFYDPLKNPDAPTIGTAIKGVGAASVPFTAPSTVGGSAITSYGVQSTPGGIKASGSSSPISVTGLTNGTAYTFAVWALNSYGPSAFSAASNSVTPAAPNALIFGGNSGDDSSIVSTTISTGGTAVSFGTLTVPRNYSGALGSSTRAVVGGGNTTGGLTTNAIEYISFGTSGSTDDFGDLTNSLDYITGFSNSTIGCFSGGGTSPRTSNIQYITIASTGNSTFFSNLLSGATSETTACGSTTRGIIAGGSTSGASTLNNISYISFSTVGSMDDFGDLTITLSAMGSGSSSTRAVMAGGLQSAGGGSYANVINYITIASTGNAIDFGDLTTNHRFSAGVSDSVSLLICGGEGSSGVASRITIATTGNSTTEGSGYKTVAPSGCSSAHGGI